MNDEGQDDYDTSQESDGEQGSKRGDGYQVPGDHDTSDTSGEPPGVQDDELGEEQNGHAKKETEEAFNHEYGHQGQDNQDTGQESDGDPDRQPPDELAAEQNRIDIQETRKALGQDNEHQRKDDQDVGQENDGDPDSEPPGLQDEELAEEQSGIAMQETREALSQDNRHQGQDDHVKSQESDGGPDREPPEVQEHTEQLFKDREDEQQKEVQGTTVRMETENTHRELMQKREGDEETQGQDKNKVEHEEQQEGLLENASEAGGDLGEKGQEDSGKEDQVKEDNVQLPLTQTKAVDGEDGEHHSEEDEAKANSSTGDHLHSQPGNTETLGDGEKSWENETSSDREETSDSESCAVETDPRVAKRAATEGRVWAEVLKDEPCAAAIAPSGPPSLGGKKEKKGKKGSRQQPPQNAQRKDNLFETKALMMPEAARPTSARNAGMEGSPGNQTDDREIDESPVSVQDDMEKSHSTLTGHAEDPGKVESRDLSASDGNTCTSFDREVATASIWPAQENKQPSVMLLENHKPRDSNVVDSEKTYMLEAFVIPAKAEPEDKRGSDPPDAEEDTLNDVAVQGAAKEDEGETSRSQEVEAVRKSESEYRGLSACNRGCTESRPPEFVTEPVPSTDQGTPGETEEELDRIYSNTSGTSEADNISKTPSELPDSTGTELLQATGGRSLLPFCGHQGAPPSAIGASVTSVASTDDGSGRSSSYPAYWTEDDHENGLRQRDSNADRNAENQAQYELPRPQARMSGGDGNVERTPEERDSGFKRLPEGKTSTPKVQTTPVDGDSGVSIPDVTSDLSSSAQESGMSGVRSGMSNGSVRRNDSAVQTNEITRLQDENRRLHACLLQEQELRQEKAERKKTKRRQRENLTEKIQNLKREVSLKDDDLRERDERQQDLIDIHQRERADLEREISRRDLIIQDMSETRQELESRHSKELHTLRQKLDDMQNCVRQHEQSREQLSRRHSQEIASLKQQLTASEQSVMEMQSMNSQLTSGHREELNMLQRTMDDKVQRMETESRKQLVSHRAEVDRLQSNLREVTQQRNHLEQESRRLRESVDSRREHERHLQYQVQCLTTLLAEQTTQKQNAITEKEKFEDKARQLAREKDELEANVDQLHSSLEASQDEVNSITNALRDQNSHGRQKERQIEELSAKVDDLEHRENFLQGNVEQLQKKVTSLETCCCLWRAVSRRHLAELGQLKRKHSSTCEVLNDKTSEIAALGESLRGALNRVEEAKEGAKREKERLEQVHLAAKRALEQEVTKKTDAMRQLEREKSEQMQKVSELEEQLKVYRQRCTELDSKNQDLDDTVTAFEEELRVKADFVQTLTQAISRENTEKARAQESSRVNASRVEELVTEKIAIQEMLEECTRQLKAFKVQRLVWKVVSLCHRDKLRNMEQSLHNVQQELSRQKALAESHTRALRDALNKAEDDRSLLSQKEQERTGLVAQNRKLTESCSSLMANVEETNGVLQTLRREKEDLEGRMTALEDTIRQREQQLRDAQVQLRESRAEISALQRQKTSAEEQLMNLSQYWSGMQAQASQTQKAHFDTLLQQKQEELSATVRTKDAQIEQLTARVNQLQQQVTPLEVQARNTESRLTDAQARNQTLEQTVSSLRDETQRALTSLTEVSRQLEQLRTQRDEAERQNQRYRTEVDEARRQLQRFVAEVNRLRLQPGIGGGDV